jgi:hypothetical protein
MVGLMNTAAQLFIGALLWLKVDASQHVGVAARPAVSVD